MSFFEVLRPSAIFHRVCGPSTECVGKRPDEVPTIRGLWRRWPYFCASTVIKPFACGYGHGGGAWSVISPPLKWAAHRGSGKTDAGTRRGVGLNAIAFSWRRHLAPLPLASWRAPAWYPSARHPPARRSPAWRSLAQRSPAWRSPARCLASRHLVSRRSGPRLLALRRRPPRRPASRRTGPWRPAVRRMAWSTALWNTGLWSTGPGSTGPRRTASGRTAFGSPAFGKTASRSTSTPA